MRGSDYNDRSATDQSYFGTMLSSGIGERESDQVSWCIVRQIKILEGVPWTQNATGVPWVEQLQWGEGSTNISGWVGVSHVEFCSWAQR